MRQMRKRCSWRRVAEDSGDFTGLIFLRFSFANTQKKCSLGIYSLFLMEVQIIRCKMGILQIHKLCYPSATLIKSDFPVWLRICVLSGTFLWDLEACCSYPKSRRCDVCHLVAGAQRLYTDPIMTMEGRQCQQFEESLAGSFEEASHTLTYQNDSFSLHFLYRQEKFHSAA